MLAPFPNMEKDVLVVWTEGDDWRCKSPVPITAHMDPADYFNLYSERPIRRAVAVTTVVCVWYLGRLWWKGELYGRQLWLFVGWFVASLTIQFVSPSVLVWIAGFLAQVALAIVLILKHQWNDFP